MSPKRTLHSYTVGKSQMAINTYKFFQECVTTSTGPMQHELHFSKALPHLYTQREAMMLSLRRVVQQNQPEISFEYSSEDEGAPDVPDTAYPQVATMKHDELHCFFCFPLCLPILF